MMAQALLYSPQPWNESTLPRPIIVFNSSASVNCALSQTELELLLLMRNYLIHTKVLNKLFIKAMQIY